MGALKVVWKPWNGCQGSTGPPGLGWDKTRERRKQRQRQLQRLRHMVELLQSQTEEPLSRNVVRDEAQCNGFIEGVTEQTEGCGECKEDVKEELAVLPASEG